MKEYTGILPANIEKIYTEYLESEVATRKFTLLLDTYNHTIHYLGCILLSEYMSNEVSIKEVNDIINQLSRPSLGSWVGFINCYSKHGLTNEGFFVKELPGIISAFESEMFDVCKCDIRSGEYKKENALDAILQVRNMIAHGAKCPNEKEAEDLIERYDSCIYHILEKLKPLFDNYDIGKVIEIKDGSACSAIFEIINNRKEASKKTLKMKEIPNNLMEGDTCLIHDDNILIMSEFLINMIEINENYLLYDGMLNRAVIYLGTEYKTEIGFCLEKIRTKFTEKGVSLKWKKNEFDMDDFRHYLKNLSEVAISLHVNSGKYIEQAYMERKCDYIADEFLQSDKTTLVVKAEAGVGKTNFMCHTIRKVMNAGDMVYFVNGSSLTNSTSKQSVFERMTEECIDRDFFPNMNRFLEFLHGKKKGSTQQLIFVIDAVNEAYNVGNLLSEIDAMTNLGEKYPWLKIIISIRTVSYEIYNNQIVDKMEKRIPLFTDSSRYYTITEDSAEHKELEIKEWSILEAMSAFEKYREKYKEKLEMDDSVSFHKINRALQKILCNPLNMSIYFSVIESNANKCILSEIELFAEFYNKLGDSSEMKLSLDLQRDIIEYMIENKCNYIDSDEVIQMDNTITMQSDDYRLVILSSFERLKDAGIIYEKNVENKRSTVFVYQKYLEYLLYQNCQRQNILGKTLVEKFVDSFHWRELPEAIIAYYQVLLDSENRINTLQEILLCLVERKLSFADFEHMIMKYIYQTILEDTENKVTNVEAVFAILEDYDLLSWGVRLISKFYIEEEKTCTQICIDVLVSRKNKLTVQEQISVDYYQALIYQNTAELELSVELFKKCSKECDQTEKDKYNIQIAKTLRKSNQIDKAEEILNQFFKEANNDKTSIYFADALVQRGLCYYARNDLGEAQKNYEMAREITISRNDNYTRLYNELGLSTVYSGLGMIKKSKKLLLEIYEDTSKYGYQNLHIDSMNGLAANCVLRKEYKEAIYWAKQGLLFWEYSQFYAGQMVMTYHIINAMVGMEADKKELEDYLQKAMKLLPYIKEKIIIANYEKAAVLATGYINDD